MWFFRNVLVGFSRYMVSLGAPLPHRATPWTWTVDPPRTNFNFSSSFKFFVNINAWDTPGVRHCQWACKLVMFELDVDSQRWQPGNSIQTFENIFNNVFPNMLCATIFMCNRPEYKWKCWSISIFCEHNVDLFLFFVNATGNSRAALNSKRHAPQVL